MCRIYNPEIISLIPGVTFKYRLTQPAQVKQSTLIAGAWTRSLINMYIILAAAPLAAISSIFEGKRIGLKHP